MYSDIYFRAQPLSQTIRQPLACLGIYPAASNGEQPIRMRSVAVMSALTLYLALSVGFMLRMASSFQMYADCYWITSATMITLFVSVLFVAYRKELFDLIYDFENIIEQRIEEDLRSRKIYGDSIELVIKITNIYDFAFRKFTLFGNMLPCLFKSLIDYYTTDLGGAAFVLPFPLWVPFSHESLHGYFLAYSIQFPCIYAIMLACTSTFTYFVVAFVVLMAFADDIKIKSLDLTANNAGENNNNEIEKNLATYSMELRSFVVLHTKALQFVNDLLNIYEFYITSAYFWCLSAICSSLLMIQFQILEDDGSLFELIRPLILNFWSFCTLFVFCYFGQYVTNQFGAIYSALCSNEWYTFPIEIQRFLPMAIASTQQEVAIRGFGNLLLTLETFKRVVNSAFSFFMVFRELAL